MSSPPSDISSDIRATSIPSARGAPIADDILYGAEEIASFLFGDRKFRRRVYSLVDGNELPVFRMGMNICGRKSVLLEWIAAQERANIHKAIGAKLSNCGATSKASSGPCPLMSTEHRLSRRPKG
jgi:hypothetical protein